MSMGYAGKLIVDILDEKQVIYKYACGNVNSGPDIYYADMTNPDGMIAIDKRCFVEPQTHQKLKKTPSGKKKTVETRMIQPVDYESQIRDGLIKIKNASACWHEIAGIDFIALKLLFKLFHEYQNTGKIPETISIHY